MYKNRLSEWLEPEPEKTEDTGPEKVVAGRCKRPRMVTNKKTGKRFPEACGICLPCRDDREDSFVGGAVAEAASSARLYCLTLTYEDRPDGLGGFEPPRAALRIDNDDYRRFIQTLRNEGFDVRGYSAAEYGEKNGRAHFHVLLFVQYSEGGRDWWRRNFVETGEMFAFVENCEPLSPKTFIALGKLPFRQMRRLCEDPNVWLVYENAASLGRLPYQRIKQWPHGNVTIDLVKGPLSFDPIRIIKSVKYVAKYAIKCPWMDSAANKRKSFEELDEWTKQTARNHKTKWGAWVRGNPYKKKVVELRDEYMREHDLTDEKQVPLLYQPYLVPRPRAPRGGLGRDFFAALGVYRARHGANMLDRKYRVHGFNRNHTEASLRRYAKQTKGKLPGSKTSSKPWKFTATEAQYKVMGDAFNAELARLGRGASDGRNGSYRAILERREYTKLRASGPVGYDLIQRARTLEERDALIEQWGKLPLEKLKGLVPKPWIEELIANPPTKEWAAKRKKPK